MSQLQYFEKYAEPEIQYLYNFPPREYGQVLCIPAYDEPPEFLYSLSNAARNYPGKVLVILVINQPENCRECHNNEQLSTHLQQHPCLWHAGNIILTEYLQYDILWVNRYISGLRIPSKKGVGLARKIACDMAAFLTKKQNIHTHQFFCSDADVIFPDNYFSTFLPVENSAGVLGFKHIAGENQHINSATQLYELSLQHYVNGLKRAGSAYAYHTIGSCLLLNADYYIKARGFPVRPAGEDFYLLNKLQKIAPVKVITETVIGIQSRLSNRVPFGTGPAVERLLQTHESPIFYHPQSFTILGIWLDYLDHLAIAGSYEKPQHSEAKIQECLLGLDTLFDTGTAIGKLFANHKTIDARTTHLHQWFDGFKTLKTIHYLRNAHFPSLTMQALMTMENNDFLF